jgi:flavin-dependent dehydrogenase
VSRWDVAVAGGGLAGAAAACHLARAGRRVVLFEREPRPRHKVCGEFISVEARQHLDALGFATEAEALGVVPIERVRLVRGRLEAAAALPFPAWSLSRRRLDGWLLAQARRVGAAIRLGEAVQGLRADGQGVRLATAEGEIAAEAALLATGKHDLRGHKRAGGNGAAALIGLKMHLRLVPAQARALDRHVEIVLFPGGYAGLQPIEEGRANLCLLVGKERFADLGRDWCRLVAGVPHLALRLADATPCWPRPLAIYRIPYGFLHRDEAKGGPIYRIGDQLAVIPSFTGDGMAMALHGARLAAAAILADHPPTALYREAAAAFRRPLRLAALVAAAGAVPALQLPLAGLCRLAPGLMTALARHTRIAGLV